MKSIVKLFCYLFLFFSHSYFYGQKDSYTKKIDSLIQLKDPRSFNGVVLVTQNNKVKYYKAYGVADITTGTPLKLDDQFEIMSNTKQITAVLLLKEVEKGKVNLQEPIKKYLPFLKQSWADSVTVHQLLNHTHGILDQDKPLAFKPGTDFKYGNLSNILLGKIIENSSHKSYAELANILFNQLKMNDTFCYSKNNRGRLVYGHMSKDNILTKVQNSFIDDENLPADGVVTTAKDLSIWNHLLHNGKILNPKTYSLMTTPSVMSQHNVFGKDKMGYGYGIRMANNYGINYFGHTGLGDGFASLNVYIPASDVSIIALENQMTENSDAYYYFEALIKDIILQSNLVKK